MFEEMVSLQTQLKLLILCTDFPTSACDFFHRNWLFFLILITFMPDNVLIFLLEIQRWFLLFTGAGRSFLGNLQAVEETTSRDYRVCTAAQRDRRHVSYLLQGKPVHSCTKTRANGLAYPPPQATPTKRRSHGESTQGWEGPGERMNKKRSTGEKRSKRPISKRFSAPFESLCQFSQRHRQSQILGIVHRRYWSVVEFRLRVGYARFGQHFHLLSSFCLILEFISRS